MSAAGPSSLEIYQREQVTEAGISRLEDWFREQQGQSSPVADTFAGLLSLWRGNTITQGGGYDSAITAVENALTEAQSAAWAADGVVTELEELLDELKDPGITDRRLAEAKAKRSKILEQITVSPPTETPAPEGGADAPS